MDFLCPGWAAYPTFHDQDELGNNVFYSLTGNIKNCNYLDVNNLNFTAGNNTLTLLHVNVRSLQKNFDSLYDFFQSLKFLPHVICLSETRLKNQPSTNLNIPNYGFVHVDSDTSAGGVGLYILNSVNYKIRENQYQLANSESFWINIILNKTSSCILGVVYRHPSAAHVDAFIDNLSTCLTKSKSKLV